MRKLKWFFGEFFVVVSGVLVAFLLNGWWMSIKEAEKERNYLGLIYHDIQTAIDNVSEVANDQHETANTTAQLLKFSYMTEPPAQQEIGESILRAMRFSHSNRVSATLSSLVNTGELSLIRGDSLRHALGELVSDLAEYSTSNNETGYSWLIPAFEKFATVVDIADLRFQIISEERMDSLATDSLMGFPYFHETALPDTIDLHALIREKDYKNTVILLHVAQTNLYLLHVTFLEKLNHTKALLEKEMERLKVDIKPTAKIGCVSWM